VRFTFDDTRRDEIYLANIQLSRVNGLLAPTTVFSILPTDDTPLDSTNVGVNDNNQIKSMRSVQSASLGNAVEIELNSSREFLPQVKCLCFALDRGVQPQPLSEHGETNTVVFTLTAENLLAFRKATAVKVQYGSGGNFNGWNFGKVDKNMLGR
jgi:hypothetical protein